MTKYWECRQNFDYIDKISRHFPEMSPKGATKMLNTRGTFIHYHLFYNESSSLQRAVSKLYQEVGVAKTPEKGNGGSHKNITFRYLVELKQNNGVFGLRNRRINVTYFRRL